MDTFTSVVELSKALGLAGRRCGGGPALAQTRHRAPRRAIGFRPALTNVLERMQALSAR